MREIITRLVTFLFLSSLTCAHIEIIDSVQVAAICPDFAQNHSNSIGMDISSGGQETPVTEENILHNADVIATKYGNVRGYPMNGTQVWQFLDIPYATFDADNPFQEPSEPEPWKDVREITEHSSRCPQLNSDESYTGSPNCLTLSVFVSHEIKNSNTPILFHIHDGGFIQGSGDPRIYGPAGLVSKNIILVLPNYRLGPLGFLYLDNNVAPGNAALKDLTMALKWTTENIELFGGNPLNIVASGSGYGAVLAEYLTLSPKSTYISKVITESGTVLSHWAIDRTPLVTAKKLITRLNSTEADTPKHLYIFNNTSIETVIRSAKGLVFRPCVDGTFLNLPPWNLLHVQKLNQSFMLGATDRPGLKKAMSYTEESISKLNKDFGLLLPNDLTFEESEQEKEVGKRIKIQYFGNDTITLNHRNELSLCHSDCSYLSPGIRTARLMRSAEAIVYLYEFSYEASTEDTSNKIIYGAAQGESLKYVFQRDEHRPVEGSREYNISNLMTSLWVSFIHTGKPTAEGIDWEEFKKTNSSEEKWLSIGTTVEVKQGFHVDRLSLWTEIYEEHFIDHNVATQMKPALPAWIVMIVGCMKNL